MAISIDGLTPHQVELLDAMWACDTFEEYQTFYDLLDEEDQQQADMLQRLILIECLDEDMINMSAYPDAMKVIDSIKK